MKPKVLVTGSCGFIGHHLVRGLMKQNYWVIGVDNFKTGIQDYARESQEFRKVDVVDLAPVHLEGVKYVFHLAAWARIPVVDKDPASAHHANVLGTLNVLQCAKKAGVEKVIYSSSSSVYGDQSELPIKEWFPACPKNNYGVQKLAAELYCEAWRKTYGLPTVSLRYFNVFGEEQPADNPYTGVITRFLELNRQGMALTIYGDGEQTRDFTYVGDVVRANILAAESGSQGVFNVGSGTSHSISEIAGWISSNIVHSKKREGETRDTLADITNIKNVFGWEPGVDLKIWIKTQSK